MIWLLFLAVLVLVVTGATVQVPVRDAGARHASDILDERLAAGEISEAEHRDRLAVLTAPERSRRRRMLAIAGAVVALLVAAAVIGGPGGGWWGDHGRFMAAHMGWSSGQSTGASADPIADARTLEVVATDLAFAPDTIEVTAGEPVNVRLVNDGQVFHDLSVADAGFKLDAEPGHRVTGGLGLDERGSYEFLCTVPGHAEAGMRGTIVVTEAGPR